MRHKVEVKTVAAPNGCDISVERTNIGTTVLYVNDHAIASAKIGTYKAILIESIILSLSHTVTDEIIDNYYTNGH